MVTTGSHGASTLAGLEAKMTRLVSESGYAVGLGFVPQPSDVIIASYAKCGTTWLQHELGIPNYQALLAQLEPGG